jgi:hypothetical protein
VFYALWIATFVPVENQKAYCAAAQVPGWVVDCAGITTPRDRACCGFKTLR